MKIFDVWLSYPWKSTIITIEARNKAGARRKAKSLFAGIEIGSIEEIRGLNPSLLRRR